MLVDGKPFCSIWFDEQTGHPQIIDQTVLPHRFHILSLPDVDSVCHAIRSMQVRGAPLIGVTAAYGMALGLRDRPQDEITLANTLLATRPTAVNLRWAVERIMRRLASVPLEEKAALALQEAHRIADEDVATCSQIGEHGLTLIQQRWREVAEHKPRIDILTHCNAGWLATVDWGTALAPIYKAHAAGIPLHVWVDETRPRNQGAHLTAWELAHHGIAHTVISDNTGGHLMQEGLVDMCLVGSDRTTARGDVCNKIGTYLKALAAHDNNIPFYVALPVSTIDWTIQDGLKEIPIEQRDSMEVIWVHGVDEQHIPRSVRITPAQSPAVNYAFDVTPARLVSALITECGVFQTNATDLPRLKDISGNTHS